MFIFMYLCLLIIYYVFQLKIKTTMKKILLIVCTCVLLCQSAYAALIPEATAFRNYAKMLLRLCRLILFFSLSIFDVEAQNFSWAKSIGGTGGDTGNSIAVDALGNVYTTGIFINTVDFDPGAGVFNLTSVGGSNIFVSKLDASGNFVWAKSTGSGNGISNSIAVDASGSVYTTGSFNGTVDFDPGVGVFNLTSAGSDADIFVSKLDASGNFVWAKSVGAAGGSDSAVPLL
jgi:Beta-propeller repeat